MKIIYQNVNKTEVFRDEEKIASINRGYVFYVGIGIDEKDSNKEIFIEKLQNIVKEDTEILILSQFTLFCKFKGNKPSFHRAEKHEIAKVYFYDLIKKIKEKFPKNKVEKGIFGSFLKIKTEGNKIKSKMIEI